MDVPLLLAGPIVRRADPGLVAVWAALSEPAEVTLKVWEGRVAHDTTNAPFATSDDRADPNAPAPKPGNRTLRVGEKLHLVMLTARLQPASGKTFQPHVAYGYNLTIKVGNATHDLNSLGLLTEHQVSGTTAGPLGYADRLLPSFVLPPTDLDHLRIAYGSCRRPGYDDGDALAWMDHLLEPAISDTRSRLHQLFLGGDQIYADDVASVQMLDIAGLGVELIGAVGGEPIERITVDKVLARKPGVVDPVNPQATYEAEDPVVTAVKGGIPAGPSDFPVGRRLHLTQQSAQFTSSDGDNHLISLGEFAAAYLMAWSPACWGEVVSTASLHANPEAAPSGFLSWVTPLSDPQDFSYPDPGFPERVPEHLFLPAKELKKKADEEAELKRDPATWAAELAKRAKKHRRSHRVHREFLQGLWRVQRLLANVPTYMIMDDHDLTDDFFLSPMWRRRVLGSALGQTILTNGMLAYALFQDWGNDPRRYDHTTAEHPELGGLQPGDLLDRTIELFPEGNSSGPAVGPFETLGRMFGHDLDNQPLPNGRFAAVKPPITWHFGIDGPKHRVLALDNRTRRSYLSEIGPPGNVSTEALVDQLPPPPLPAGVEVLVVIAPLQVIGPPVLDEIVGRAIYRIFDAAHASDLADDTSSGSRQMPGTNPDALETWALDEGTFEHLLGRLADYQRVVLLSGDVHNAASNLMSYWRGTDTSPARIAQFTSSGFKNVMPVYLRALDANAMLLQQLLRAKLGVERLGWARPEAELVLLPTGRTEDDLVAVTRAKLLRSPVLLPTHGWIDDNPAGGDDETRKSRLNPARLPEWRWRVTPLLDVRPDVMQAPPDDPNAVRPSPIRAFPLDDAVIEQQAEDPATTFAALRAVAVRHQHALERMRNTRQMMLRSNFGICRFESQGSIVTAVGEVYTQAVDPDTQLPVLAPYLVHRAPLGPLFEKPPTELRRFAIERVPIPAAPQPPP